MNNYAQNWVRLGSLVPSPRDNVTSSLGRAAEARADTATASINVVGNQDWVDGSTQVKQR